MPKSSNQKLKLLYIKDFLEQNTDENNYATVNDIIAYLESCGVNAERKSIYTDIEALRSYGMDIVMDRNGKSTGYSLVSRTFELPELKLLVDAVQSSKFITEKKSRRLIKNIETLTSTAQAKMLDKQVDVAAGVRNANEKIYYLVDDIHNAIMNNKKIKFRYFDWNESKEQDFHRGGAEYSVSPYHLIWDDENYYLVGKDDIDGTNRHYRVDKMTDVSESNEARDLGGKPEITGYSKKLFGMFGGAEELVTLKCNNSKSGIIIDRFGKDTTFIRTKDSDTFEISVKVAVSPLFFSWISNFGGDVKLTSPKSVVDDYKTFIKKAMEAIE